MDYVLFNIATIIMNIVFEFSFFHLYYEMKNQKCPKKPVLIVSIIIGLCSIWIANFNLYLSELLNIENGFINHFVNLFIYNVFFICLDRHVKDTIVYTGLTYLLWISLYSFINQGQYLLITYFAIEQTYVLFTIVTIIVTLMIVLLTWGSILVVRHYRVDRTMHYINSKLNSFIKVLGLYILVFLISTFFMRIQSDPNLEISTQMALIDFFVFVLVVLLIRFSRNRQFIEEKIMMYEVIMSQQEMYIKNLEDIQQNLRTFKHDYKNMMASLYLQSKEGQIESIEQSLSTMIEDFDNHIDSKMNLTNQLANIQMTELKSLLFQKLTKIHQNDISFHLEVLYPIQKINMKTIDVSRILGILLDNAIEETKGHGDINLIFSKQDDGLHIIVDNSLHHEVNLSLIYNEGYSTKGEDRGLGLSSLLKIIENYSNVSHTTNCESGRFIQEIFIGE